MVPDDPVNRTDSSSDTTPSDLEFNNIEEMLRRTEADLTWYRTLYESIPSIYFTLNSSGVVLSVNSLGAARLGYTAQELTEKPVFNLFHPEDQASLQEGLAAFLDSSLLIGNWEVRACSKDGSIVWVKASARAVSGVDNLVVLNCEDISEQRRGEQGWDRFFALSLDLLCIAGFDGYFKRLNPTWEKLLGITCEELLSKPFIEFVHPDDHAITQAEIQRIIVGADTINFKNRYLCHDGSSVWLSWKTKTSMGEQLFYATARDITYEKQIEGELQQSNERVTQILESITDAFYALDHQWRFTYLNAEAEQLLQRSREDLIGKCLWDEIPQSTTSTCYVEYHRAVSEKVAVKYEEFYPPFNQWFAVHAYPAEEGLAVYFDDITERKQAEMALQESEERYRRLVDLSPDAIFIYSEEKFVFINPAGVKLFAAANTKEIEGKPIWDLVHPDSLEIVQERVREAWEENKPTGLLEIKVVRLDGQVIDVESVGVSIIYQGKQARQVFVRDISDRKRAEAAQQQAHDELEIKVEERTTELRNANGQLQNEIIEHQRTEAALRESEARYRDIFEKDIAANSITTPDGRLIDCNGAFLHIFGFHSLEEARGCHMERLHPSKAEREAVIALIRQRRMLNAHELHMCRIDGTPIIAVTNAIGIFDDAGELIEIHGHGFDITERKRTEAALRESEERFELVARATNDAIWDWDLVTDTVWRNEGCQTLFGYTADEIVAHITWWYERIHPEDVQRVISGIHAVIDGGEAFWSDEYRFRRGDATYSYISDRAYVVHDDMGKPIRLIGGMRDISERKLAEEQLRYNAFYDALTGLPNRALFIDRLEQTIERAKRHQDYVFAVLFLDLDRFKVLNDSLGHNIGDQLLIAFSRRLEACLRSVDTVARLGGDEFVIFLEDITNINEATHVAERIRRELALPFNLSGHEVFITTSIGIALSTTSYEQPEDLLRDADIAMYRAKSLGKARYEIFDPVMHTQALTLLQMENDLHRAVEREEFQIYYQPIVELQTSKLVGFEALVRWQHPNQGLVSPLDFIPVAEETGLIVPIGYWILRSACRQLHRWQSLCVQPLTISVNLSGKQFSQPDLIEQVDQILQETSLAPCSLTLELTESMIMEDESATVTLLQLRDLGIELSIDDFGTGYSSLGRLLHFPINTLKIDRSFVSGMGTNQGNLRIIQALVTLAHQLGMEVIAEGVETVEQLTQLRALKCEYGQGYFFSRPLDCEAAEVRIVANPQW